jgi:hypothetical protein
MKHLPVHAKNGGYLVVLYDEMNNAVSNSTITTPLVHYINSDLAAVHNV